LIGEHVTMEHGTGLVHTAPAHGMDDYLVCKKAGLSLECIGKWSDVVLFINETHETVWVFFLSADEEGRFVDTLDQRFVGKFVLDDGNDEVLEALKETHALVFQEAHVHRYPYDWRTKKPVIVR
jgi:isoleucyl-tRNA synthetase